MSPQTTETRTKPQVTFACNCGRHEDCKSYGYDGLWAALDRRSVPCLCPCHGADG